MAGVDQRSRKGQRRPLLVKNFRQGRACERRGIGLKPWGVLAQCKEWTRRGIVVFVEKMVDEVRGKSNQVDEEESGRQRADGLPSPWHPVVPAPGVHGGLTVSD